MNLRAAYFLCNLSIASIYASSTTAATTVTTSTTNPTAFCPSSPYNARLVRHTPGKQSTIIAKRPPPPPASPTRCQNFLNDVGELWDEFIEMATYGPGERKLMKARRAEAAERAAEAAGEIDAPSLRRARDRLGGGRNDDDDNYAPTDAAESVSPAALRDEVLVRTRTGPDENEEEEFDGYALRDLLVSRWGAPLDIEFQRGYDNKFVYCTVSPVAFGSRKCRHESEIDYLCHLQGVVETLGKYGNVRPFREFIETTKKTPKPGTDSVPFRLRLTEGELKRILGKI